EGIRRRLITPLLTELANTPDDILLLQGVETAGDRGLAEARTAIQYATIAGGNAVDHLAQRNCVALFLEAEGAPADIEQHLQFVARKKVKEFVEHLIGNRRCCG